MKPYISVFQKHATGVRTSGIKSPAFEKNEKLLAIKITPAVQCAVF
jgi:hypothetical protein